MAPINRPGQPEKTPRLEQPNVIGWVHSTLGPPQQNTRTRLGRLVEIGRMPVTVTGALAKRDIHLDAFHSVHRKTPVAVCASSWRGQKCERA